MNVFGIIFIIGALFFPAWLHLGVKLLCWSSMLYFSTTNQLYSKKDIDISR